MENTVLDKNLEVKTAFGRDDVRLFDPREKPFSLFGVFYEGGCYRRVPDAVASRLNPQLYSLTKYTAGGRVCFSTDSAYIGVRCERPELWRMPHMALCASAGFDMYYREGGEYRFIRTFMPDPKNDRGYESGAVCDPVMRDVIIDFPLYCPISDVKIGLSEGAEVRCFGGYKRKKPIVFYGSSITQGACASTAGNDYISRVARHFDSDYVNLGFSGNAKGEDVMMEHIAGLEMSAFVYDYDHNAPTADHLEATHFRGYEAVRNAHPDIPVVMMTRPNFDDDPENALARRAVILRSYERAKSRGDRVAFIDGAEKFSDFVRSGCTVDRSHPNDLGFYRMAHEVINALSMFLEFCD